MAKSNWKSVLCRNGQQDRRYNVSGKEILEIHPREASKKKKDWVDIKKIKIKCRFPYPYGYFSISRARNNHRFCRKRVFYNYTAPKRSSALSLQWEPLQSAVVSIFFFFFCIFHSVIYDHITCTYLEYFFSPHRHAVDCLRVYVYLSIRVRYIRFRSTEDLRIYEAPGGQFRVAFRADIRAPVQINIADIINVLIAKCSP